jgi:predicted ATP-binding protein involved in virulence
MRIKKIRLREFKRFDDLTIDLGEASPKIVALVGPNGCGKSSIFDAFEEKLRDFRSYGHEGDLFFSKAHYSEDEHKRKNAKYNKNESIEIETLGDRINRTSFYIRTAYRFTSKLSVNNLAALPEILNLRDEPISSIALDARLESNYKRLVAESYSSFFVGEKTGIQVRAELIDRINEILLKVIDAEISDLGNIMEGRGQLYFKKGNSTNFPYANLSSGEKEVVDIIIDLLVKKDAYTDTVICIDEPELHLNTAIQRKLLIEIDKIIPENCQLWVATHSIGFLRALQEELKGKAAIIDFSERDFFSGTHVIRPMVRNRANWQRIFSTALEDLTGLISPKTIIYCEGKDLPGPQRKEQGLDAQVFNNIFSEQYPDALFISSGGNTELDQRSQIAIKILTKVFSDLDILVLKDRDMASGHSTDIGARELYLKTNPPNHRVLKRWEIENYLYDKTVLKKYCAENNLTFDENLFDSTVTDINNELVKDITGLIKKACGITISINPETFKLALSKQITPDMMVYKEMKECIFQTPA